MKIYCTNPNCSEPENSFPDLRNKKTLLLTRQRYCFNCGTPLILNFHYLPTRLLGKGGFGAAFLALNKQSKQFVIKQLRPQVQLNEQQFAKVRDLFHREAEFLAELGEHEQIPQLYDFFELSSSHDNPNPEQQWFYLVQEYIDGESLGKELARKGKLKETEIITFLEQILPVVQFVHRKNAIHRDIKPANIMRDRTGKLYLIDFGAVKEASQGLDPAAAINPDDSTPASIFNTSIAIGSPVFASPEQMNPHAPQVSRASDLHALGVTCICLLAGEQKPQNLFNYSQNSNYWNYSHWESKVSVSPHLAKIINRMLCESPRRFKNAEEVLEQLHLRSSIYNHSSLTISALSAVFGGLLAYYLPDNIGLAILVLLTAIALRYRFSVKTFYTFIIAIIATGLAFYLLEIFDIGIFINSLTSKSLLLSLIFAIISGLIAIVLTSLSQLIYQLVSRLI